MQRRSRRSQLANFERCAQREFKSILRNKKAASVVVSTIILTAGVVAMSIAVLYWTYSMGKIGNHVYSQNTAASSAAVEERIGIEYAGGSGNSLTLYVINWGKADNVGIIHVLILDRAQNVLGANRGNLTLYSIDSGTPIPGNKLQIGGDAYLGTAILSPDRTRITQSYSFVMLTPTSGGNTLTSGNSYFVRIVTANGRNYDYQFEAQ
jgi:hypothetical protein